MHTTQEDGSLVVWLSPRVTNEDAAELNEVLEMAVSGHAPQIIIDASQVTNLESKAIGVLINTLKNLQKKG